MAESPSLVLAIDQGTSSTKAVAVDATGSVVARGSAPLDQQTPRPGWVEHRADDVAVSVRAAVSELLDTVDPSAIAAVGLANQRESLLLWDRTTGRAISPVLSWQDRRTIDRCADLLAAGHGDRVRALSGLPLDPMFSAVKAAWLLDEFDPDRSRSAQVCLGTVDSWLAWQLTGEFVIEAGNASRTSLVDLGAGDWSPELLDIFGIPREVLPRIVDSVGAIGDVAGWGLPSGTPLAGILGDSHAALFAHAGWRQGVAKATYGTGSSVMAVAAELSEDSTAMCRTIAWRLPGRTATVAWEANILSAGSTLAWLASVLGTTPDGLAREATGDSHGVTIVPAFNGLGAPWWDSTAQAVLVGLSLATTRADLAQAALDSVAFQVSDVVIALASVGVRPQSLVVDGAMTTNAALMQRQADLCALPVRVSQTSELSALGAAHAAGLGAGVWSWSDLESMSRDYVTTTPRMDETARRVELARWRMALDRSLSERAEEGRF